MSDNKSDEYSNDEELAPMVDGLSGALCIFILITTVFMISGIDTVVTGIGRHFTSEVSQVDLSNQVIYFDKVISLSNDEYQRIKKDIKSKGKKNLTLEAFISPDVHQNSTKVKRELIYNLLELKRKIDISGFRITLKVSEEDFCSNANFCIKWSVD